eukprot:XP_014017839.1 PREDICTED: uncharacterized protein LOC106580863 isoform X3 [Salmo salar]
METNEGRGLEEGSQSIASRIGASRPLTGVESLAYVLTDTSYSMWGIVAVIYCNDPDRELQDTTARDPLPDLLLQRERSPQASPQHRAPGVADPRLDNEVVERVANQLKRIGDDLNATILQRMGGNPQQQDWRGLCLGVLNFLSDTLSILYRLR